MVRHGLIPHCLGTTRYSQPASCWGSETVSPKRECRGETVEIDMSSPPAAATFDARAAYAARVDEEALRLVGNHGYQIRGQARGPWSIQA